MASVSHISKPNPVMKPAIPEQNVKPKVAKAEHTRQIRTNPQAPLIGSKVDVKA